MSSGIHERLKAFFAEMKKLKKAKKLHATVESRLGALLKEIYPDAHPVSEIGGILGGRNDMMQFFFNGRRVVFELFASPSQVSQDLRLLEQCDAQVKIAILLDPEIDPKLSDEYFRKKPNAFPFLWIKEIMMDDWKPIGLTRLRELIDEESSVNILRRILASRQGSSINEKIKRELLRIEKAQGKPPTETKEPLTLLDYMSYNLIKRINKIGVPIDNMRSLFEWFKKIIPHAVEQVSCGLSAYLVTDLNEYRAVWSNMDFEDYFLIMKGCHKPHIVFCLDEFIKEWLDRIEKLQVALDKESEKKASETTK